MAYTPKQIKRLWARQDSNLHAQRRGFYGPLPTPAGSAPALHDRIVIVALHERAPFFKIAGRLLSSWQRGGRRGSNPRNRSHNPTPAVLRPTRLRPQRLTEQRKKKLEPCQAQAVPAAERWPGPPAVACCQIMETVRIELTTSILRGCLARP